jgi:hypothetical protein
MRLRSECPMAGAHTRRRVQISVLFPLLFCSAHTPAVNFSPSPLKPPGLYSRLAAASLADSWGSTRRSLTHSTKPAVDPSSPVVSPLASRTSRSRARVLPSSTPSVAVGVCAAAGRLCAHVAGLGTGAGATRAVGRSPFAAAHCGAQPGSRAPCSRRLELWIALTPARNGSPGARCRPRPGR